MVRYWLVCLAAAGAVAAAPPMPPATKPPAPSPAVPAPPPVARPDEPPGEEVGPEEITGEEVFQKCARAYASIRTYAGTTMATSRVVLDGNTIEQGAEAHVAFQRPGKIRI